jgi:putative lipoic acid-binding regulatory protein
VATPEPPSLIEYPGLFPIKVMGANDPGFEPAMVEIARQFDPSYDPATLQVRPSSGGKYLGLTLTVTATSREQLDNLYRVLSAHALVRIVI